MTTTALAITTDRFHVGELAHIDVAAERAAAEEAILNALAPATRRAYASDWAAFTGWCAER